MILTANNSQNKNDNTKVYVPSSSDKKRAIMMYLFFGIMVSMSNKNLNVFEKYHLRQAIGRWIIFLLVLVFDVVLLFLPIIKYIALLPLILLLAIWVFSVKQSRDWKYHINHSISFISLFSSVGTWFMDLFDVSWESNQNKNNWGQYINDIEQDMKKDLDNQ